MLFCSNCGAPYEGSPNWCAKCGSSLRVSQPPTQPLVQPIESKQEKVRGLNHLKNSFLIYLIAAVISLVPLIGVIGGLLQLVALILLIMGWRALGRSNSPSAPQYKSAGKWFIYAIIAMFVVGAAGAVILAASIFSSAISSGGLVNPQSVAFSDATFQKLLGEFFVVISFGYLVVLFAWYKVSRSLRTLAVEVSQPRLVTAGWLLLLSAVVGFVSICILALGLYTGALSYPYSSSNGLNALVNPYSSLFSGGFAVTVLIGFVGSTILIVSSYFGYDGLKRALAAGAGIS